MSLLEAIREATGQGCDVLFYDDPMWEAITIQLRRRLPSGKMVATANAQASHKELVAAVCPEAVMEHRVRLATEKVLDDSQLD
jgi:hypothetical protein